MEVKTFQSPFCFAFDLEEGFYKNRVGGITAAFIAMDSMVELAAKALYNLASSETKDFLYVAQWESE